MKKIMIVVLMMIMVAMVGCGKTSSKIEYVRAYDEETGETLGYIYEENGYVYIIGNHDRIDEIGEMVSDEIQKMNIEIGTGIAQ